MNPILNQQAFAPSSYGAFAGSRSFQAEQTRAGSVSLEQTTALTITTDEGDTVTLNLASTVEVNAGTYRSVTLQNGQYGATSSAFFELSTSQGFAMEVQGDLSEEELADIREAVAAIGTMIDDFLSGDLQQLSSDGELLNELDTISGLEAAFSYQRQITYGEQERVEIATEAPVDRHHRRRPHSQRPLERLLDRIDRITDQMAERVNDFDGQRNRLTKAIGDLFGRYLSGETAGAPEDELGREVIRTMQSVFEQKIQTYTDSASVNITYTAA